MELDNKHIDQIGVQDVAEVPERISWHTISSQILSVLNIEKGVFYTLVELLFRPGKAVRLHLFKNRKKLLNPVRFLVLSSTLATFITLYYVDVSGFKEGFEESFKIGFESNSSDQIKHKEMQIVFSRFGDIFRQFLNLGYFALVPIGALITWLFCRKRYNVPELAIVHCYLWSMVNCFTIILTPLVLFHEGIFIVLSLLSMVYPLYFYTNFFKQGGKGFLKGGIILMMSMIFLVIFFGVITVYSFLDIETVISPNSSKF